MTQSKILALCLVSLALLSPWIVVVDSRMVSDEDRLAGFEARNYTWPPREWVPSTLAGLMERRIQQIEAMEDLNKRFDAYVLLTAMSGILGRNFTKYGYALTRAPAHLVDLLTTELHRQPWKIHEPKSNLNPMGLRCLEEDPIMVDTSFVNQRILEELLGLHEQWASEKLIPTVAYGMRVYKNQSQLLMHVDNARTHVVSSILHIGRSEDAQEWPLVLQDYTGNTIEVHMEPGDLLLYESSRLLHGRPQIFNGSWYTSLFIHYKPRGYWKDGVDPILEMEYALPADWDKAAVPLLKDDSNSPPAISMLGMGVEEAECGGWCDGLYGERLVLRGPARGEGILETAGGLSFIPRPERYNEDEEFDYEEIDDDEEDAEDYEAVDGFDDEF